MKEREIYADLRTLSPLIIRLDGRAFHRVTRSLSLTEPFDERFSSAMSQVTKALIGDSGFAPVFGYTFSDEISLFFLDAPFLGRIEKIDSVLASFTASSFTLALPTAEPVSFDARVIPVHMEHIIPYLIWRQKEAWRNHMNGWSQKLMRDEGYNAHDTASILHAMRSADLHELCFQHGINLAQTPAWQRRGILVYRTHVEKEGFNPKEGVSTTTTRRIITIDKDIPLFHVAEGKDLVEKIVKIFREG